MRRVVFNEYNIQLGKACYLPLVSGLLRAYAETVPAIKENYQFAPFLYKTDAMHKIMECYTGTPDVAAFSVYVWNEQLSLAVAAEVKKRWPGCLVVFGGAQVPHKPTDYFQAYPFIDVAVRGEGEEIFAVVLERALQSGDFSDIPQTAYRTMADRIIVNQQDMPFKKELDALPSPYLQGLYDDLMATRNDDLEFQAIIESTRDCPFRCLSEGTLITTKTGPTPIELVLPGDEVLGWDENRRVLSWHRAERSIYTGTRQTFKIIAGGSEIESTENHPFFTQRGWINADRIRPGDQILQNLRDAMPKNWNGNMLMAMLGRSSTSMAQRAASQGSKVLQKLWHTIDTAKDKARTALFPNLFNSMRASNPNKWYAGRWESDEAGGIETQGSQCNAKIFESTLNGDERAMGHRQNCSGNANDSYESECLNPHERKQSDVAERCCSASSGNSKDELRERYDSSLYVYRRRQTTDRRDSESENVGTDESHKESRSFEKTSRGQKCSSEWIRDIGNSIFDSIRSAVSIYRRFCFLGRSMQVAELAESRFYSHYNEAKKGDFGPRSMVAQGCNEESNRIKRLQEFWMGLLYNLGRRKTRQYLGEQDYGVCWTTVDSIAPSKTNRVYDLLNVTPGHNFFANGLLVHNCSFCFYGRTAHKFKYYEIDRVMAEIDWVGRNGVKYLFNADSNFGMQHRDRQIAEHLVATKKRYGYPEKFRTNFGKNADDRIYEIGLMLHEAQLEKGITLARQSNDSEVLKNIKRTNIKMSTYENLQVKFNDADVLVYSEFIMGLPGETLESWKRGLDETVAAGMKNQCLIYPCMILANTDMADLEYQRRHGLVTRRIEMAEIHGSVREEGWLPEYEDIVVATNTMPIEDWRKVAIFSYVFTLLHGLKVGYFLIVYLFEQCGIKPSELIDYIIANSESGTMWRRELDGYEEFLDGVLDRGAPMAIVEPEYGDIYWEPDEISFLRFAEDWDRFYHEFRLLVNQLLSERDIIWASDGGTAQTMRYQNARMPRLKEFSETSLMRFDYNLHRYFTAAFGSNPVTLKQECNTLAVGHRDFQGDQKRFAREVVLFGRKNGTLLERLICINNLESDL